MESWLFFRQSVGPVKWPPLYMRHRQNDDHPVIHAIHQAVRRTVEQAAANPGVNQLIEFGKRGDQTYRPIELIQKTEAEPDNLGFVPCKGFIKLLSRGSKQRNLQGLRYFAITVS